MASFSNDEAMGLSRALDSIEIGAANILGCWKDPQRDPKSNYEWIRNNVEGLRKRLLNGHSTADLQLLAARGLTWAEYLTGKDNSKQGDSVK